MSSEQTLAVLVRYLEQFRGNDSDSRKPAFWLGAGCSVWDGVPLNNELLRLVLPSIPNAWGSPQFRFDQFCDVVGPGASRAALFERHFERQLRPDSPYRSLAKLLLGGYSDVVFTFNIDDLLEQALEAAGCREGTGYRLLKMPEIRPEVALDYMRQGGEPRIRVVKLHGDYRAGFNSMTSTEIISYEEKIADLVREFSRRAAVICGYSFFHLNVLTAFSQQGGALFYVNKSFPDAPMVLSLMAARSRAPLFIDGSLGCFETFMVGLAKDLGL